MIALLASVFAAGLLGSLHCAGMCGGFVCFYSGHHGGRQPLAHAAYNLGRLLTYLALGALAGLLGAGLDKLGAAAGVGRAAAWSAGVLMIVWGGLGLGRWAGLRIPEPVVPGFVRRRVGEVLRSIREQPPAGRALVVGVVTTLIPCGFLYAYVTIAAGAGTPLNGMLVMLAFWSGTLPIMAGLGITAGSVFEPLRRRLPALTPLMLALIGLLTITGKLVPMSGHAATGHAQMECHDRR